MATQLKLDPETERAMDELMLSGSYGSREQLLREAVRLVRVRDGYDEAPDAGDVDEDTRAAVERGIADVRAGRARAVADVFRDLRQRYDEQR